MQRRFTAESLTAVRQIRSFMFRTLQLSMVIADHNLIEFSGGEELATLRTWQRVSFLEHAVPTYWSGGGCSLLTVSRLKVTARPTSYC